MNTDFNDSEIIFYEHKIQLDELLELANECKQLEEELSKSFSPQTQGSLFRKFYLLGSELIRYEIYGEGINYFEKALNLITNNPSFYFVSNKYIPPELLPYDNLPLEFYSIVHTLITFYIRIKHLEKCKEITENNIFVKRGTFIKNWLSGIVHTELYRKQCLKLRETEAFKELVGVSEEWLFVFDKIQRVAKSEYPVLITGPSGSGKELVAKAIHEISGRRNFTPLNCISISDELCASEMFGHEKGSFTGAITQKRGLCEVVGDGTLFLDEIGNSSLKFQGILLRLLQEAEFMMIGGREKIPFKGRIIAATNKDIPEYIQKGSFLEDMYWRLKVHEITIPPLSERPTDIEELILFFIKKSSNLKKISAEAIDAICNFYEQREVTSSMKGIIENETDDKNIQKELKESWGIKEKKILENNVRELKNLITKLGIEMSSDTIRLKDLQFEYREVIKSQRMNKNIVNGHISGPLAEDRLHRVVDFLNGYKSEFYSIPIKAAQKEQCQRQDIEKALVLTGQNQSKVAILFQCSPQAINQRVKKNLKNKSQQSNLL